MLCGRFLLSILYIVVCMCQSQSPNIALPPPNFPLGNHKFVFYICDYFCSQMVSEGRESGIGWAGWFWLRVSHEDAIEMSAVVQSSESLTGLEYPSPVAHSRGFWPQFLLTVGRRSQFRTSWAIGLLTARHLPSPRGSDKRERQRDRYTLRWNHMT